MRRRFSVRYLLIEGDKAQTVTQDMRRSYNVVTGRSTAAWHPERSKAEDRSFARMVGADFIIRVTLKGNADA